MPCLNRLTKSSLKLPFPDGKHYFYGESACGNGCDGDLCDSCKGKKSDHGLVNGPYVEKSHIYGTTWYLKAVRTYGEPDVDILEKAMDAQKKARSGGRVAKVSLESLTKKMSSVSLQSQASSTSSPTVSATPVTPGTATAAGETPKKKRGRPSKKVIVQEIIPETENVVTELDAEKMVETMDEPLEVHDVIRVVLRPFIHDAKKFWRDEDREKIYEYISDNKKGAYIGRWDGQGIEVSIPDSDEE